ncbi:MAG: DUF4327 family protein [Elainella sp. C42_A2020_010]|nr:DUF4327 family protein [Elainella sp. C42_A2020_010]RNJ70840.1 MAG: DUF4327 family protein [Leptolyngbya sp. IPPAS B-1204]
MLQDEVYPLIQQKLVSRQQPLAILAKYFSARD